MNHSKPSNNDTILDVQGLTKHFPVRRGILRRVVGQIRAVEDLSFTVRRGETLGIVGESGCGKTTAGRCIIGLHQPTAGDIYYRTDGAAHNLAKLPGKDRKPMTRHMQMIFQDPFSSLNPRMTIRDVVAEPLTTHRLGSKRQRSEKVAEFLQKVGLESSMMDRYPHEFSGGQRQRIAIARSLILEPDMVICDESVSALDVSVQAQVINLLRRLQREMHLTYLFIAHDLGVVEHISDRVLVMYLGRAVELASEEAIYRGPKHPYT